MRQSARPLPALSKPEMPLGSSLVFSVLLWAPSKPEGLVPVSAALHTTKWESEARKASHGCLCAISGGLWTRLGKELQGLKVADGGCPKAEALRGHTTSRAPLRLGPRPPNSPRGGSSTSPSSPSFLPPSPSPLHRQGARSPFINFLLLRRQRRDASLTSLANFTI